MCGCYPTGRKSVQTFSNWLKKGTALFCTSDSSFWFAEEEVGLVPGISLLPGAEGAEGLYWEQHQSCFPGLSQQSRECGNVTLGLTHWNSVIWSRLADFKRLSLILPSSEERNREITLTCTFVLTSLLWKWRHRCWGWLASLTLSPLLSLLNFSGLKLVCSMLCNIHHFHPSVSLLEYLFWLRNKHFPSQNHSEQWCFIYK